MLGMSTSSICPRGGFVWLTTHPGETVVLPTTCKTWDCRGCRDRLMALFTMRVEVGVLALGPCAFMTITYRQGENAQRDALSAATDWKELWRRLRRYHPTIGEMKWLRVTELTKRSQPHFHVVLGPVTGRVRCYGSEGLEPARFKALLGTCDCLAHVVSGVWLGVTSDSWIVDATPVVGPGGSGRYLAKYMRKGSLNRGALERLGFHRRWSSSRGWPGSGRIRLRQTVEGGWRRADFSQAGAYWFAAQPTDHRLLDRVGNDLALVLGEKRHRKASLAYLKKVLKNDDSNVSEAARAAQDSGRGRPGGRRHLSAF